MGHREPTEHKEPSNDPTGKGVAPPVGPSTHFPHGTDVPHEGGIVFSDHLFTAPPVPGGKGSHGTSVDTPSMAVTLKNLQQLIPHIDELMKILSHVHVAPGTFYDANMLRTQVNGPNADAGLKKSYAEVLSSMKRGFVDLTGGLQKLISNYGTTEDISKITAKDLADAIGNSPASFNSMMTNNGGSAAAPPGGPETSGPPGGGKNK
ncbi:hypothetical protein [Streptomyces fructofermentans]|uniref:hypothetical protein n=1 Tax=Streptomyces fructofermentans TaxID=152141 RepID=UPI0033C66FEE